MITKEAIEAAKKAAPPFWRDTANFEKHVSKILTAALAAMPAGVVAKTYTDLERKAAFTAAFAAMPAPAETEIVRHKKRGTTYDVIAKGRFQVDGDLDMEKVTVYRGQDGQVWVRPDYEFNDGRFETIPAITPAPDLAAENERLRAAMEKIARRTSVTFGGPHSMSAQEAFDIAAAALEDRT